MFSLFVSMARLLTLGTRCLGKAILRAIIEEIDLSQRRALIRGKMERVLKNAPLLITVDEMDPEDMIIKFEQQQKIYGLYGKNVLNYSVEKDEGELNNNATENKSIQTETKVKNETEINVKHELSKLGQSIAPSPSKTSVGTPFGIIPNMKEQGEQSGKGEIQDSKDNQNSSKDDNVWINTILDSIGISVDAGKKKIYPVTANKIEEVNEGKKDEAEFAVKHELIKAGHTPNPMQSQQTTSSVPSEIIMKLREQRKKEEIQLEKETKLQNTSKTRINTRKPDVESSWVENLAESFFGSSFKEHRKPEEKPLIGKQSADQIGRKKDEKSKNIVKFSSIKAIDKPSLKSVKSEPVFNKNVNFIQKTAGPLSPKPKSKIPASKSKFGNTRSIDNIEFTNFVAYAKPVENKLVEKKKSSKNADMINKTYPNFKLQPSKPPKSINKFTESKKINTVKTTNTVKTVAQTPSRNVKPLVKTTENKVGSGEFPKKVRMSSMKNEFSAKKNDLKSEYVPPFNNKIPLNQMQTSAQGDVLPRYTFNKFSTSNRNLTEYKERLPELKLSVTSNSENKLDRNKGEKKYSKYVGPEPKRSSSLSGQQSEKIERKRISSFSLKNDPRIIGFLKKEFPEPAESAVRNDKLRSTKSLSNLDALKTTVSSKYNSIVSTGSSKYSTQRSVNSSSKFDTPRFSETIEKNNKSPVKTNVSKSTNSANQKNISYLDASKLKKNVMKYNHSVLPTAKRSGVQKCESPESRLILSSRKSSDNKSTVQNEEKLKLNIKQISNKSIVKVVPTTKSSVPSKIFPKKSAVMKIH